MSFSSRWLIASAATVVMSTVAATTALPGLVSNYIADARVAGAGSLTWFGLSVYDARLIVPAAFRAENALGSPLVLEITYARSLSGAKIAERSRDEIVKLGIGTDAQRARWLEAMTRVFPDVKQGTRIAGVYLRDRGARFYVDGSFAGAIEDPEFARAFFSIWLDERTSAPRLRDALLSGAVR